MAPEVLLCPECHERVDLDQQEYVVTNRDTARTTHNRLYAHLACVQGKGRPVQDMTDMEVEAVHRRILSELDEEAMERLGIRRIDKASR
jgi:hypothetical protein